VDAKPPSAETEGGGWLGGLVERPGGDTGLDDGRRPDEDGGGGGGQQPGPEQSCSREHVGSFSGGDVPPPLLRCNDRPRMDLGHSWRGAAPDPRSLVAVSSSGGELERAVRAHRYVSAICAELQRECLRIQRVCRELLRENEAIIERIRMTRGHGPDAEPPPYSQTEGRAERPPDREAEGPLRLLRLPEPSTS
jgi:hypothetical protein